LPCGELAKIRSAKRQRVDCTVASVRFAGPELGDAQVTEQGGMALTGHSTPQAFRLYVKRTDTQRMTAARQRRAWVEANETGAEVRIGRQDKSQNERG
jgi:hypothetical protein